MERRRQDQSDRCHVVPHLSHFSDDRPIDLASRDIIQPRGLALDRHCNRHLHLCAGTDHLFHPVPMEVRRYRVDEVALEVEQSFRRPSGGGRPDCLWIRRIGPRFKSHAEPIHDTVIRGTIWSADPRIISTISGSLTNAIRGRPGLGLLTESEYPNCASTCRVVGPHCYG